jgi:Ca2+-binding EF-hand superfamily protein
MLPAQLTLLLHIVLCTICVNAVRAVPSSETLGALNPMRLFLTVMSALTLASAQERGFGPGPGRARFPVPNIGFTALDINGDGTLDSAEIDAAPKSLAKLDKNLDGQITSDEIRLSMPQREGRGGPRGEGPEGKPGANLVEDNVKTLMAFDANSDGKLSRSELPERFQGLFTRGDTNGDGFLTPDEIRKMAAAQAPPPESVRPGGRGAEGRPGEGPRGNMNFIRMDPILAAIDSNGDGILSADEIRDSAISLRKLDKDSDGTVTREEAARKPGLQEKEKQ